MLTFSVVEPFTSSLAHRNVTAVTRRAAFSLSEPEWCGLWRLKRGATNMPLRLYTHFKIKREGPGSHLWTVSFFRSMYRDHHFCKDRIGNLCWYKTQKTPADVFMQKRKQYFTLWQQQRAGTKCFISRKREGLTPWCDHLQNHLTTCGWLTNHLQQRSPTLAICKNLWNIFLCLLVNNLIGFYFQFSTN